jgi:carbamoyl-phosphate synthase large subunit
MPKRTDIDSICILGSGPIVIGQACEFDYSGSQAIRSLKEHGFRVILVNSNPATIMTDPDFADATYVEPLTAEFVEQVLEEEQPDALLPTMGGQTGLNLAVELDESGALDRLGVELIGASPEVIDRAENRQKFSSIMDDLDIDQPASGIANNMEEAWELLEDTGFPAILRPSFTMGGAGGNIAYNRDEFEEYVKWSLSQSPTSSVLIDESLVGWKEFELEVMRDRNDNAVIICSVENLDPLGIHTGDSITVSPIQTLADREYQAMRDDALRIIRAIGVETGGCNIQFAVDPETGRRVVIEMNPRVSRSSALASKATGYPIAKISALLGVGFTLDEIANEITGETQAAFEPMLDYVIVKMPRFAFDKFPEAEQKLTTQMKSVGEAMAIGRNFPEALQKAVRSLEIGESGFSPKISPPEDAEPDEVVEFFRPHLMAPHPERIWYVFDALRHGVPIKDISEASGIDPWFLGEIKRIVDVESDLVHLQGSKELAEPPESKLLKRAKRLGLSDQSIARVTGHSHDEILQSRRDADIRRVYKQVDTCAAEFEAVTSYFYSSYDGTENETTPDDRETVIILGSGPNRIGQGIEFDYCAVHASLALREAGYRTVMVNCNPETVSTDYDISDRLYFEPLTFETVMSIVDQEDPKGVILQFGGQTPLRLAEKLDDHGVNILGSAHNAIDRTEDRGAFNEIIEKLDLNQPEARSATTLEEAKACAAELGYPVMVRPSFVLGGVGMQICYEADDIERIFERAASESEGKPVLIDKFLNDAVEVDVDCVADGENAVIGGIMEHIEEAGVHSGDSACVIPPYDLPESVLRVIREKTRALADELDIIGLMNVQFAVRDRTVYVLEVNPRASRTIPFVSKAIGEPLTRYAARAMVGETLPEQGLTDEKIPPYFSVKEVVFPFDKFANVDTILGPEMRSTGEVMGISEDFNLAFYKAQVAASNDLPETGSVFISVKDADKWSTVPIARGLSELGWDIVATRGTAHYLEQNGLEVEPINKVKEGQPHIVDAIINGEIDLVINTTIGAQAIRDSRSIRRATVNVGIPYFMTVSAARAAVEAMHAAREQQPGVASLQRLHRILQD